MFQPKRKTVEMDGEDYAAATSSALEKITGQQFGQDSERWRRWATENAAGRTAGRDDAEGTTGETMPAEARMSEPGCAASVGGQIIRLRLGGCA